MQTQLFKKSFILIIVLAGTFAFTIVAIYLINKPLNHSVPKKIEEQELQDEINFVKDTEIQKTETPFIEKMPIKTNNYTIIYNSVSKGIVAIINDKSITINDAKVKYEKEILQTLTEIGVNPKVNILTWQLKLN